jgi:integrase
MRDSRNGYRVQMNGRRISENTLENYKAAYRYLQKLEANASESLSISSKLHMNRREVISEKKYWNRFYKSLKDVMYLKNACSDNYVGMVIKIFRTFFRYLENNLNLTSGGFYKTFYPPKSEIPVFVLDQEKLMFLINNSEFAATLSTAMKQCKDIFVFGCTVGLRFSDLKTLNERNLEIIGDANYIINVSKKTSTSTRVKLPAYCMEIIARYQNKKQLLPIPTLIEFNKRLKQLGELAGWTHTLDKHRAFQGCRKSIKNTSGSIYRYCDHLSSHVMRKTAISTMLILGMPESLVRKVSGHAANSQEFYRYVRYTEAFVDAETDKVFNKLYNASILC